MTQQAEQTLLTPEVKALIGRETSVREMHGVVDEETIRRYVLGIPDQDPRHWDEDLARSRFGATTTPALLVSYISGRKPPWEPDDMPELMLRDPFNDSGGAMTRRDEERLPSVDEVAPIQSHLNAGEEFELYQYPKIGDRIFYQSRLRDIQEKTGRDGRRFLLTSSETRYWNQDDELLLITRGIGIHRP